MERRWDRCGWRGAAAGHVRLDQSDLHQDGHCRLQVTSYNDDCTTQGSLTPAVTCRVALCCAVCLCRCACWCQVLRPCWEMLLLMQSYL
jgi:hypothetical protein